MPSPFRAIAVDYDGTIAEAGAPCPAVLDALARVRQQGLKAVLVTGRVLDDLVQVFPDVYAHFDLVVAENGAVLAGREGRRLLAPPVPSTLDAYLTAHGVEFRRGSVLLATDVTHDAAILAEIHRLGLDCQLVYNRGALMLLPAGVTKGTGLYEGLGDLHISQHSTLAVGDAENDHDLLEHCEVGVAVANALDSLKSHADVVLDAPDGEGVAGLLGGPILAGERIVHSSRWQLLLGHTGDGAPQRIPASLVNILVAGGSRSGKSYAAGLIAERLIALRYSVMVIDPEGDYVNLGQMRGVLLAGGEHPLPTGRELRRLLEHRFGSIVLDLSLLNRQDMTSYLRDLPELIDSLRRSTGLPHWVIVDEAHVPLGSEGPLRALGDPASKGYVLVTYRPNEIPVDVLAGLDVLIALRSEDPADDAELAAAASSILGPAACGLEDALAQAGTGRAVLLRRDDPAGPRLCTLMPRTTSHVRHWHKYAGAQLPVERRFYWRSAPERPTGAPAANLVEFHREIATCPQEVLDHHAALLDFSRWFDDVIRDPALADQVRGLEQEYQRAPGSSACEALRAGLLLAIETRYLG